jgi:hypothetical protein
MDATIAIRRILPAGAILGAAAGGSLAPVTNGKSGPTFWAGLAAGARSSCLLLSPSSGSRSRFGGAGDASTSVARQSLPPLDAEPAAQRGRYHCVKLSERGNRTGQGIGAWTRFLWFVAAVLALSFAAEALIHWKVF